MCYTIAALVFLCTGQSSKHDIWDMFWFVKNDTDVKTLENNYYIFILIKKLFFILK